MDMKLEVVVVPVNDVDRAKKGGCRPRRRCGLPGGAADTSGLGMLDHLQHGITSATPGSAKGLHLVVTDIEAARAELADRGAEVSDVFHDVGGVFHHAGTEGRVGGPAPDHKSYGSFASFSDPDSNGWLLQEITTRLPGR